MRATPIILFLITCLANLSAGSHAEKDLFGRGPNYVTDTTKEDKLQSFIFASATAKNGNEELDFSVDVLQELLEERKTTRFLLGRSKQMRIIEAWFFPGSSEKKALIIGGVHGTELSSTEVAATIVRQLLRDEKPFYNVIIIPCLFPDNALLANNNAPEIGSTANIGRYSFAAAADPNRQMPSPGEPFDARTAKDHLGREIEMENQFLLQLISVFKPDRIANIHAIRDRIHGGIYADPRTDDRSIALGFETDSSLAVEMASLVYRNGGYVPGNRLNEKPTALYYKDPPPVTKGNIQKRNFSGSSLPSNRGSGITLGTWASTAITGAEDQRLNRPAMRIFTIEFPGYKRPGDYKDLKQQDYTRQLVQLYARSIENIFLGKYYIEDDEEMRFADAHLGK